MTFIPSVLSKLDNNNSTTTAASNFSGTSTETTGYTNLIITIKSNIDSSAGGIVISFSSDNTTFTSYYTDTYFTNTTYNRTFKIINKYYKISYTSPSTPSPLSITSFLDTNSSDTAVQISNDIYSTANDSMHDAFGKLRVTFPTTLLDNKFPSGAGTDDFKKNNMMDCYKNTGLTSFTYGNSKVILTATGTGTATSQSRKYCVYQPGKSILILLSGVINASSNTANCTTRLGYFDNNNGLFFQYTNNIMSVVLRNITINTSINQTSWNIDKMDGTGISSISLDFTKAQLYVIDFEWLSVGRIRFGFYLFGKINYCHQITNINTLTAPYMLSPNLPIRYEIISTSGATGSLVQICSTVISEGGYTPIGRAFSIGTDPNTTGLPVSTTEVPIIAITGISTYNHENILPTSFTIMDIANNNGYLYRFRLYLSPTDATSSPLNGIPPTIVNVNSVVAYSITGLTIPAGSIIVDQGYFYGRGIVSFNSLSDVFTNIIQITSNIDNVCDVLLLTAEKTGTTGTGNVFASISWQEIY
jgi:hypothetical protein